MENLWEELNHSIPEYFDMIIHRYNLTVISLSKLKTALVCDVYAIIIGIDRFHVNVDYIARSNKNVLKKYICGSFLAEKYDAEDRKNLIEGIGAKETIINNFIVIRQGLVSKWSNILEGDRQWLDRFENSKWFEVTSLREDELILNEKIK